MERDSEGCREREREEEMEVEPVFEVHEVDLDYEFDAVMYFDFTRPETREEARLAELWFVSAAEYPPSPFVTKLVMREDMLMENVNTSPKSKDVETTIDADVSMNREVCAFDANSEALFLAWGPLSLNKWPITVFPLSLTDDLEKENTGLFRKHPRTTNCSAPSASTTSSGGIIVFTVV